jgi:outer membrane protein insertion porin family
MMRPLWPRWAGWLVLLVGWRVWAPSEAHAAPPVPGAPSLGQVVIQGNVRVEEDAVRVRLRSRPGQPLDRALLDQDLRAVYAMGFFDRVDADVSAPDGGKVVLTFILKERPLVRGVKVEGASTVKTEDLEGALRARARTILDPEKARQGIEAAKKLYADKGYLDVDIAYTTTPVGENEVDLVYTVNEKGAVGIVDLDFEGNEAFSGRRLRGLMQTSEKNLLSFVLGTGNLNKEVLKTDIERLTAWYYDNGYVTVRIDEPQIDRDEDGIHVRIKIDEGPRFDVGAVNIAGANVPPDTAALQAALATKVGESFSAGDLRDDVQKLTDRLSDDGYAFTTVEPKTNVRMDAKKIDIVFEVDRGKPAIIEQIEVTGNSKTRDEVIRREMRVQEQQLFSGTKLRKSREALQRLGFFQEVNVSTRKGSSDDRMDVVVNVKEGQTGAFSAGAGFSSDNSLLFNVRLQENNLFGRGQRVLLNADVGSIRRNIIVSFSEPYLFETPLTLGLDGFSWRQAFDDFDRSGTGGSVSLNYPVTAFGYDKLWGMPLDEVRVGLDYRAELADISGLGFNATRSIRLEEGQSFVSSLTPRISRNTLNHAFDPTAGSLQSLSLEVAGLGGRRFLKAELRERWYYTFLRSKEWGDFTYSLGASYGYGVGDSGVDGDQLPLFERYFPGGINSIRGFRARSLGPREQAKDRYGRVVGISPIGGTQEAVLNNEIIFPLVQGIGLKGLLFVDAGNAYGSSGFSLDETRLSAGAGVRWLSPVGPLRIEVGKAFRTKRHDRLSLVLFSFGGPFQF